MFSFCLDSSATSVQPTLDHNHIHFDWIQKAKQQEPALDIIGTSVHNDRILEISAVLCTYITDLCLRTFTAPSEL